jgi:hypothetical protein
MGSLLPPQCDSWYSAYDARTGSFGHDVGLASIPCYQTLSRRFDAGLHCGFRVRPNRSLSLRNSCMSILTAANVRDGVHKRSNPDEG